MAGSRGPKWSPKYKIRCRACGWEGKRTKYHMHKPCPDCAAYGKMWVLTEAEPVDTEKK